MAVTTNGSISYTLEPLQFNNDNGIGTFYENSNNYLKSVNEKNRFQITWDATDLTEGVEASIANGTSNKGDVVYIKFRVQTTMDYNNQDFKTIATINKSRDISSKHYSTGAFASNHRFTVDISDVLSNELTYSLCPIGKGTWQSNDYGGMNGGRIMPDNVLSNTASSVGSPRSFFNVSKNGTFRLVRVKAVPYIINSNGEILEATGTKTSNKYVVINSINQVELNPVYYSIPSLDSDFLISGAVTGHNKKFLTRCTNFTTSSTTIPYKKPVRLDDAAEYLNFFVLVGTSSSINAGGVGPHGDFLTNNVAAMGIKVETFLSDGSVEHVFYVRDFEDNLTTDVSVATAKKIIKQYQYQVQTQNISPYFLNNTAPTSDNPALGLKTGTIDTSSGAFPFWQDYSGNKITTSTSYYRVSLVKIGNESPFNEKRHSEYRYFSIDREDEKAAYGFVRFHWLNSMGATDSYTAKRNITEGLTISRGVIERNSTDTTWYQNDTNDGTPLNDGIYISDTMRGGDIYKGGREVLNVNAEKTQSVYTEPLNRDDANWLKGMMLSPNVWIEMDTNATKMGNAMNPYLRPSDKEYIPVIITNSEVETTNEEVGLVTFNIEYVLSHKVITQRN
tara:strand:+ start:1084 stop:2937 length:1854 start_codon:yes stop_codon:yes gene_type:complete